MVRNRRLAKDYELKVRIEQTLIGGAMIRPRRLARAA